MKLRADSLTIERDGIGAETGFKIAANAKAFEILSSKLYSDVPRAIVRELSTNAFDAHVEAGNPEKPFDVHLPNFVEPWFEIRDYGTGLSEKAVTDIYTVYFASTRSNSNDYAGCLGLGSKTPFAYTNAFTVTSFVNGTEYAYTLFKNERGEPSITKIGENPTKQPNGVAIRIAIKNADFQRFVEAAQYVYTYFKVKPNVVGAKLDYDIRPPIMTGDGYTIRQTLYGYNDSKVIIVMGQVAYAIKKPIHMSNIGFNDSGIIIELYANIGDYQTTASREEIQLGEDNDISPIISRLEEVFNAVKKQIDIEINVLPNTISKIRAGKKYEYIIRRYSYSSLTKDKAGKYCVHGVVSCRLDRKGRRRLIMSNLDTYNVANANNVVVLENDLNVSFDALSFKTRRALTYWLEQHTSDYVILASIQDKADFQMEYGDVSALLSQLPQPPKEVLAAEGIALERHKSCIRRLMSSGGWEKVENFEEVDNAAVVLREGNKVVFGESTISIDEVRLMMGLCGITTLYGIPTRVMNKYDGDLPEIFELAKEKAEKMIAEMTEYDKTAYHEEGNGDSFPVNILKELHGYPEIDDYLALYKARSKPWAYLRMAVAKFNLTVPTGQNYVDALRNKYPLLDSLRHMFGYQLYDHQKKIVDELKIYLDAKNKE